MNDQLQAKLATLPMSSGCYLMKDKNNKVIYVGKSRKLKQRVSQYFQNSEKNIKTAKMVLSVYDFDYILCETEIEALTLENTLIKQYSPRYNIRLKDAKSYPYIKITSEGYPRLTVTRQRASDKAQYFGPYSGMSTAYSVVNMLEKALGLPTCKRRFPKDIGKERPCIYWQMGRCCGVCAGGVSKEEYSELIHVASDILRGNTAAARKKLESEMYAYADAEKFESAARIRDTINALSALSQKQHAVSAPGTEVDVIGFFGDDMGSSISVLYVRDGALTDKSEFNFGADELTEPSDIVSFICRHYQLHEYVPKTVCVSVALPNEDEQLLSDWLSKISGRKITVYTPQRGKFKALSSLADENAAECAKRYRESSQKDNKTLLDLANLLKLESLPERIEAYDISNFGAEMLTAGMIVCENGRFSKSDYRVFKIKSVEGTDDYASMREALSRRFAHLEDKDGSFSKYPDLILLDGGRGHVATVKNLLYELGVEVPVFGVVKDEHHKTRALTTEDCEINIAKEKQIFILIYKIQEEVHRFTVSKMESAKSRTIKRSSLETIDGIGPTKSKKLLGAFGGIRGVKAATKEELSEVKGITKTDAENIYKYFNGES